MAAGTTATIAPTSPTKRPIKLKKGPGNREAADLQAETQEKSAYLRGCVENLVEVLRMRVDAPERDECHEKVYRWVEDC